MNLKVNQQEISNSNRKKKMEEGKIKNKSPGVIIPKDMTFVLPQLRPGEQ